MAGKITRLGDPANPYGKKKTPTAAPTPAQQARNRAASDAASMRSANAAVKPKPAAMPVVKQVQMGYAARQNARIDGAVNGAVGKKRK